jgi:hypothetical protein
MDGEHFPSGGHVLKRFLVLLLLLLPPFAAAGEPAGVWIPVAGTATTKPTTVNAADGTAPIQLPVGRFLAIIPDDKKARTYLVSGDAGIFDKIIRKPGHPFWGVKVDSPADAVNDDYLPVLKDGKTLPPADVAILVGKTPGTQVINILVNGDESKGIGPQFTTITIQVVQGNIPPPPKPDPKPDPVDPVVPTVDPLPGAPGFKVFIVYPKSDKSALTTGQVAAIYGQDVRQYLESKCAVGPDGKTKQYRIWGDKEDASQSEKVWRDAYAKTRPSIPYMYVSDGKAGWEGPLPADLSATMSILKKYGGQ